MKKLEMLYEPLAKMARKPNQAAVRWVFNDIFKGTKDGDHSQFRGSVTY